MRPRLACPFLQGPTYKRPRLAGDILDDDRARGESGSFIEGSARNEVDRADESFELDSDSSSDEVMRLGALLEDMPLLVCCNCVRSASALSLHPAST